MTDVPRIAAALGVTICDLYGVDEGHAVPAPVTIESQLARLLGVAPERVEINLYAGTSSLHGGRSTRRLIDEYHDLPEDQRQEWRDLAEAIRAEEEGEE